MNRDFGTLPTVAPEPKPMNGDDAAKVMTREFLHKPRARRQAAQALALAWQGRYRRLLEATGEDEIVMATGDLAQVMYENVEFAIWALKTVAGMNPPPPEVLKPISKSAVPPPTPVANDPIAEDLGAFVCPSCKKGPGHADDCPWKLRTDEKPAVPLSCTCPPMDKELIGANRHMTSCPLYQP